MLHGITCYTLSTKQTVGCGMLIDTASISLSLEVQDNTADDIALFETLVCPLNHQVSESDHNKNRWRTYSLSADSDFVEK